jgi:C-terminal processing protease CtpA/Prc
MPDSWYTKDGFVTDSCPPRTKAFFDKMNSEHIIQKENPLRYWEIDNRNIKQHPLGTYKGKVIMISNHYNASAGETTLARIKSSIPNSVIIGENSCGAFVFSSKNNYCLKNSLIKLSRLSWK